MGRIPTVFDASAASLGPGPPDSYGDESSSSHDTTKAIRRLCRRIDNQLCWRAGAKERGVRAASAITVYYGALGKSARQPESLQQFARCWMRAVRAKFTMSW